MGIENQSPELSGQIEIDEYWMQRALEQARRAANLGEVPVGSVLVSDKNESIAEAHNQPIGLCDPSAHAEIEVLRKAASCVGNYRLPGTTLYVTLEPCTMCVGAIVLARIDRVVYGAAEQKTGAIESAFQLFECNNFNHKPNVTSGVLADTCADLMSQFFSIRRQQKRNSKLKLK